MSSVQYSVVSKAVFSNQKLPKLQSSGFYGVSLPLPLLGRCPQGRGGQGGGGQDGSRFFKTIFFLFFLPIVINGQTNLRQAEEYFKQERFSEAQPLFETHLKQNPRDKQTLEYLGDIAVHHKNWDDAVSYYKKLLQWEEGNANYHYKYGAALGMKALSVNKLLASTYIGEIKREFELAAKLDPNHIGTRWALVEYYLQLPIILGGSENKAIAYANELMVISPVDGYLANDHIAEHSKKYKEAEQFYKKAVEVGGSPHTYDKLIGLYEKSEQPAKALATASESLKKHQINQLNYKIGKIAAESKFQPQYGIESLHQYLANYSKNDKIPKAWAYYRLAQIHKNLGEKQIALSWIDKALKDISDFKEAQKEKALILAL